MKISIYLRAGFLALVLASCSTDPNVAKQKYLARGNQSFEQRQYKDAIISYRKALEQDPQFGEARFKLAQAYERAGDPSNAAREYVRAADMLAGNPDAQLRAGLSLLAQGSFEDAKERALKALTLAPKNVEAHLLLARALAGLKDMDGGAAEVEEAIRMDPEEPRNYIARAAFSRAQGNQEQAEAAFKRAVSVDPRSVDAALALGQFYVSTGRQEAEEWLIKAVALAPADPYSNRALADFYIRTNKISEAEKPLRAFADAADWFGPRIVLADYYFLATRPDEARKVLETLLKDPAAFSEVRQRLSVLDFTAGQHKEAQKWLDEILLKNGRDARALELKGRFILADGDLQRGRDYLSQSVASDPRSARAHYWLGRAELGLNDADAARTEFTEVQRLQPNEVDSKIELARLNLRDGKLDAAAPLIQEAIRLQPTNGQARISSVDLLILQGKLPEAAKQANLLAKSLPNAAEPQMQLGGIAKQQGDYASAERAFQRAIELSNDSPDAVGALVDTEIAAGKITSARAIAEQYIAKNPRQGSLLVYAARAYQAQHEPGKAEAALKSALAADPGNVTAYLDLSRLYIDQNKLDDARVQLEAIVAKHPKEVWAHTMIAISLQLQHRAAEAQQRYEKILEIDPEAVIAANNLASLLADNDQNLDRALNLAQTAKRHSPDSPEVNDTLGSVYYKKGLASLAVPPLEQSVRIRPTAVTYQYHLGLAYAQAGEKGKARVALQKALSLNPDFDGSIEAKRVLAQLATDR